LEAGRRRAGLTHSISAACTASKAATENPKINKNDNMVLLLTLEQNYVAPQQQSSRCLLHSSNFMGHYWEVM
jgi:aminopeptidase C